MSVVLNEYLRLEQEMLRLDATATGEANADELRDFMDVVWRQLTSSDRENLNSRPVVLAVSRPSISVQVGTGFISKQEPAGARKQTKAQRLVLAYEDLWCPA